MKRFVKILLVVLMGFGMASNLQAQTMGAPDYMKGKYVTGGSIGAGFSGNQFYFGVAPQFGYRITRSLEAGVRLGYDLHYYIDYYYGSYFTHIISGSVYSNLEVIWGLYVHAEYEKQCVLHTGKDVTNVGPSWYDSMLVGAGYRQYYSGNQFVYYSILYDLNWDYYTSLYNNPFVIRMGYCLCF